jgi:hypothetical protein
MNGQILGKAFWVSPILGIVLYFVSIIRNENEETLPQYPAPVPIVTRPSPDSPCSVRPAIFTSYFSSS